MEAGNVCNCQGKPEWKSPIPVSEGPQKWGSVCAAGRGPGEPRVNTGAFQQAGGSGWLRKAALGGGRQGERAGWMGEVAPERQAEGYGAPT